jgi:MazG family protein
VSQDKEGKKPSMQGRQPLGLPDLGEAANAFSEFVTTIAWLRDRELGCPWDLEQDHASLRRYMVEEAYEAAEAMSGTDNDEIRDELGDVLLQVVLNAQVAADTGSFSLADVIRSIDSKMRRRHPHVFDREGEALTSKQVRGNWDKIKATEKQGKKAAPAGVFAGAGKKHPATLQAFDIGKTAAKIRFDWDTPTEVLQQLRSEVSELEAEFASGTADKARIASEIGDVYFSLGQLCRHLELDPETVAMDGNRKFLRRFARLESIAASEGIDVRTASRAQLEELWVKAKKSEQKS